MAYFDCIVGGSGKGNTLVVTCADDLAGATITCTNGTKTYTKTCPSTSPYEVTFYGLVAGTWTVSATVSGNTYTTTVVVVDCAALLGGFSWRTWVDTASQLDSSDYDSLSEVLADEEAVRELCLEHNCVDYLADIATANEDVETIINNDLFAKWVNNSDYALDFLHANEIIADYMDEADKYGYGEWALVGQVPKMTSNTDPLGEVLCDAVYNNNYGYYAFDGNESSYYMPTYVASKTDYSSKIGYSFVNDTKVSRVTIKLFSSFNVSDLKYKIQGYDGSSWSDLKSGTVSLNNETKTITEDLTNSTAYSKYQVLFDSLHVQNVYNVGIYTVQFYAYAPKGNVPIMTSDTAPYGTVFYSSVMSSPPSYVHSYAPFDDQEWATQWRSNTVTNEYFGYAFVNPVKVKKVRIGTVDKRIKNYRIEAANTSNFSDKDILYTGVVTYGGTDKSIVLDIPLENDNYYLYYRVYVIDTQTSSERASIFTLQFYGRELKVSVPTMTSNTTPYGEAFANHSSSGGAPYRAFNNESQGWYGSNSPYVVKDLYVGYGFDKLTVLKMATIQLLYSQSVSSFKGKIQASADNTNWVDVSDEFTCASVSGNGTKVILSLLNNSAYNRFRMLVTQTATSANLSGVKLQFYGLDYSEKEFESGTTKKWLYDHGVELETFTTSTSGSGSVATKDADSLYNSVPASTNVSASALVNIDLTNYSLARMVVGKEAYGSVSNYASGGLVVLSTTTPTYSTSPDAQNYPTPPINDKNNIALDISSFNTTKAIGIFMRNVSSGSLKKFRADELWLE